MGKWFDNFNYNPIEPLINHKWEAIVLSAKRDLLNEKQSLTILWQEPSNPLKKLLAVTTQEVPKARLRLFAKRYR